MQLDAGRTHSWYEKLRLAGRVKDEADWAGDAVGSGDLGEGAGGEIDAESDDGIGVLVFGEEELPSGVDGEVARFFAAGGVVAGAFEFASCWIDGEYGDGIVAPIGGKEPFARRMEGDFGGGVAAFVVGRDRGDALHGLNVFVRVLEDVGDGGLQFSENVDVAVGAKDGMAGAVAGIHWNRPCIFVRIDGAERR